MSPEAEASTTLQPQLESCSPNNGGCPNDQICLVMTSGILCRCPRDKAGVYKDKRSNKCVKAKSTLDITGLVMTDAWKSEYSNLADSKTVDFTHNIENKLYIYLTLKQMENLKEVQIRSLEEGSVKMTIHLLFSAHPPPSNAGTILQTAIDNNQLPGLNIKPGVTVTVTSFNGCNMKGPGSGTPCGPHGTCVPGAEFEYSCNCKPDYEEEFGRCVKDDDIGLKIALPIVLIILLVVFLFVLLKQHRQQPIQRPEGSVEMGVANKGIHGDNSGSGGGNKNTYAGGTRRTNPYDTAPSSDANNYESIPGEQSNGGFENENTYEAVA